MTPSDREGKNGPGAGAPGRKRGGPPEDDPGVAGSDDPKAPFFTEDDEGFPLPDARRPGPSAASPAGRPRRGDAASFLFDLRVEAAMCFGIGHIPFAPGTFGAAAGIPLALLLYPFGPVIYLGATVLVLILAIWSAQAAVEHFGLKDPGQIVIDEVAGQLVALAFVPPTLLGVTGAFLAFRFFDIVKPFPADRLERLPGGSGVVLDDIAAGAYACLVVHAGLRVLQHLGF